MRLPEDAGEAVEFVAEDADEDLSQQQENPIIAQAKLVGYI